MPAASPEAAGWPVRSIIRSRESTRRPGRHSSSQAAALRRGRPVAGLRPRTRRRARSRPTCRAPSRLGLGRAGRGRGSVATAAHAGSAAGPRASTSSTAATRWSAGGARAEALSVRGRQLAPAASQGWGRSPLLVRLDTASRAISSAAVRRPSDRAPGDSSSTAAARPRGVQRAPVPSRCMHELGPSSPGRADGPGAQATPPPSAPRRWLRRPTCAPRLVLAPGPRRAWRGGSSADWPRPRRLVARPLRVRLLATSRGRAGQVCRGRAWPSTMARNPHRHAHTMQGRCAPARAVGITVPERVRTAADVPTLHRLWRIALTVGFLAIVDGHARPVPPSRPGPARTTRPSAGCGSPPYPQRSPRRAPTWTRPTRRSALESAPRQARRGPGRRTRRGAQVRPRGRRRGALGGGVPVLHRLVPPDQPRPLPALDCLAELGAVQRDRTGAR